MLNEEKQTRYAPQPEIVWSCKPPLFALVHRSRMQSRIQEETNAIAAGEKGGVGRADIWA